MAMIVFLYVLLGMGWILIIPLIVLMVMVFKITPSWTFFKAAIGKKAIAFVKDRAGNSSFKLADIKEYGTMKVDSIGTVNIEEGSKSIDKKSKIPIFKMFSEFAVSTPDHFEVAIEEMRTLGLPVNTYRDYERIVKLATDDEFSKKYIDSKKTPKEKEELTKQIEALKKIEIKIKPYKIYNVNDLSRMFPFNISPVYIDAMITEEVSRRMRQMGMKKDILLVAAIAGACIMIGGALAWRMIKTGTPPPCNCMCELTRAGIEYVANNTSTLVI